MHCLGLSSSGSGTRYSSEVQIRLGLRFIPFPGPAAQMTRCLVRAVAVTPAGQFSGCTTDAPSEADDDCPEPQEVVVSKGARLPSELVGNAFRKFIILCLLCFQFLCVQPVLKYSFNNLNLILFILVHWFLV